MKTLRGAPLVSIGEFEFVLAKTEVFGSSLSLASPKGCSPRRLIVKNNENLQRLGKFLVQRQRRSAGNEPQITMSVKGNNGGDFQPPCWCPHDGRPYVSSARSPTAPGLSNKKPSIASRGTSRVYPTCAGMKKADLGRPGIGAHFVSFNFTNSLIWGARSMAKMLIQALFDPNGASRRTSNSFGRNPAARTNSHRGGALLLESGAPQDWHSLVAFGLKLPAIG
jgi:hypothetical protein